MDGQFPRYRRFRVLGLGLGLWVSLAAPILTFLACTGEDPPFFPETPDANAIDAAPTPDGGTSSDAASGPTCDGGAVDLESDGVNCGACGRTCVGGACVDGRCEPVTIADRLAHPYGVTVGGASVIWVRAEGDAGAVENCPLAGCSDAGPTVITNKVIAPYAEAVPLGGAAIVSDGLTVEWIARRSDESAARYDRTFSCNITLCSSPREQAPAFPTTTVGQLALAGSNAFYRLANGHVYGAQLGKSQGPNDTSIIGAAAMSRGLALTNDRAFYGTIFGNPPNVVFSCVRSGLESCTNHQPMFNTGDDRVSFIGVAGANVYTVAGSHLYRCGVGGCSTLPAPLVSDLPPVAAFALDEQNAFFAIAGDPAGATGEIRACALPDCAGGPRLVVTGLASPTSMAVADGVLYWANAGSTSGSGSVQKIRP